MDIKEMKNGHTIAINVGTAKTFLKRARGLLFTKTLKENSGLWIEPCNSVHTFFMAYEIDVIFLTADYQIVHLISSMKPWRISKIVSKAHIVLELPSGTIHKHSLQMGDYLLPIE